MQEEPSLGPRDGIPHVSTLVIEKFLALGFCAKPTCLIFFWPQEVLTCPCCLSIFRQPIGLPCGHSLCRRGPGKATNNEKRQTLWSQVDAMCVSSLSRPFLANALCAERTDSAKQSPFHINFNLFFMLLTCFLASNASQCFCEELNAWSQ